MLNYCVTCGTNRGEYDYNCCHCGTDRFCSLDDIIKVLLRELPHYLHPQGNKIKRAQ